MPKPYIATYRDGSYAYVWTCRRKPQPTDLYPICVNLFRIRWIDYWKDMWEQYRSFGFIEKGRF